MAMQKVDPRQPDSTDVEVGRLVRALPMSRNLSQTELGNRIGVTFQQVQKYESGANRISMGRLTNVAKLFGVSVPYLLDGRKQTARHKSKAKDSANYTQALEMLGRIGAQRLLRRSLPSRRSRPACAKASSGWSKALRQPEQRVVKESGSEASADNSSVPAIRGVFATFGWRAQGDTPAQFRRNRRLNAPRTTLFLTTASQGLSCSTATQSLCEASRTLFTSRCI